MSTYSQEEKDQIYRQMGRQIMKFALLKLVIFTGIAALSKTLRQKYGDEK